MQASILTHFVTRESLRKLKLKMPIRAVVVGVLGAGLTAGSLGAMEPASAYVNGADRAPITNLLNSSPDFPQPDSLLVSEEHPGNNQVSFRSHRGGRGGYGYRRGGRRGYGYRRGGRGGYGGYRF